MPGKSSISIESINANVINAEYAVRGEIVQARMLDVAHLTLLGRRLILLPLQLARNIEKDLEKGAGSYPFSKLVWSVHSHSHHARNT